AGQCGLALRTRPSSSREWVAAQMPSSAHPYYLASSTRRGGEEGSRQASAGRNVLLLADHPIITAWASEASTTVSHQPSLPVGRRITCPPLQPFLSAQGFRLAMFTQRLRLRSGRGGS